MTLEISDQYMHMGYDEHEPGEVEPLLAHAKQDDRCRCRDGNVITYHGHSRNGQDHYAGGFRYDINGKCTTGDYPYADIVELNPTITKPLLTGAREGWNVWLEDGTTGGDNRS